MKSVKPHRKTFHLFDDRGQVAKSVYVVGTKLRFNFCSVFPGNNMSQHDQFKDEGGAAIFPKSQKGGS